MWCLCESLYPYVLHPDWCQEGAAGLSQDGAETGQEGGQDEGEFRPEVASVSVSSGAEGDKREALVTFCPVHALDWGLPRSSFNHFGRYLISFCPEHFFFFNTTKKNQEHETLQVCTRDQNKGFKMVAVESTVHCWSCVIVLSFFLYASYF